MLSVYELVTSHPGRLIMWGLMQTAIDQATQRGVLFVASAGNDGVNTDVTPHYPSSLPDDIVLAVGASTRTDTLWYAAHGCRSSA